MRFTCGNGNYRSQVAARAIAADRHALCVQSQFGCMVFHPIRRSQAVVHRCGEPVFGCHPIVDRDDGAAGTVGQFAAQGVMRIKVTHEPAAAMVIHQYRQDIALVKWRRAIKPHGNGTVFGLRLQVTHFGNGRRLRLGKMPPFPVQQTRLCRSQGMGGWNVALLDEVEQGLSLGVQHRYPGIGQSGAMIAVRPKKYPPGLRLRVNTLSRR